MKDRKRALRRHHRARLKKKRQFYWGYGTQINGVMDKAMLGGLVNTAKVCSCWMCSNQRKVWGPPFADIRREQDLKE